jgi:peptide methionine sulfoxide reductase MsrA
MEGGWMMTTTTIAVAPNANTATVTQETVIEALQYLTAEQLSDVLQYILFLQYKPILLDDIAEDIAEDQALWQAVQAHQAYKDSHPDEQPEVYSSKEALQEALANL